MIKLFLSSRFNFICLVHFQNITLLQWMGFTLPLLKAPSEQAKEGSGNEKFPRKKKPREEPDSEGGGGHPPGARRGSQVNKRAKSKFTLFKF